MTSHDPNAANSTPMIHSTKFKITVISLFLINSNSLNLGKIFKYSWKLNLLLHVIGHFVVWHLIVPNTHRLASYLKETNGWFCSFSESLNSFLWDTKTAFNTKMCQIRQFIQNTFNTSISDGHTTSQTHVCQPF